MIAHDTLDALQEQENQYAALRLPVADLTAEAGSLRVRDNSYRLGERGLGRLCRQVRAPAAYLSELDPDIQATLIQHHLDRGDLRGDTITVITRGDEFIGIEPGALHRLTSADVLNAVSDGIGSDDLKVHRLQFLDESFQLELVTEATMTEVAPGDVLQAGLQVAHSFIGEGATWVQAFVLRLQCQNGLTYRECVSRKAMRTRRLPADRPDAHELQMAQIRRITADIVNSLRVKLEAIKTLQNEPIEVEHLWQRWIEKARLSTRDVLPQLRAAWEAEGRRSTAYDAMNAMTNVATHATGLDFRVRRILAALGGVLAFRQMHFCPRCFSLLGGSANSTTVA